MPRVKTELSDYQISIGSQPTYILFLSSLKIVGNVPAYRY